MCNSDYYGDQIVLQDQDLSDSLPTLIVALEINLFIQQPEVVVAYAESVPVIHATFFDCSVKAPPSIGVFHPPSFS